MQICLITAIYRGINVQQAEEEEVINLDFYKAIFLSSSEDEAEVDDLPVPPPNLPVAPVATKPKEPDLPKIPPVEFISERRPR